jgi:hypothetical protein
MAIRNSQPYQSLPVGISDAVDQSSAFPGSCQILSNLVFDRNNRGAVVARPGVTTISSFPGFTLPTTISVMFTAGTLIYGLIGSARNPGFDEPFCFDTVANAFVTVSGITGANVPTTQATIGAWTPPTMDAMGIYILVTHPGFSGSNRFGWFDVTNPAAPAWNAGNTTVNLLPNKPVWVHQFFGRAYFGIGNAIYFTDSLALTISNTNFAGVLTIDDQSASTGVAGLPLSQTSGAILQSLIVFKQSSIWQVSGDIAVATNPLSLNQLMTNVGCVAPRTIQSTPMGVVFIANDGPRFIDLTGRVSYLQTRQGITPDIVAPFATATTPSRMVAAYSNSVYRVCLDGPNTMWDTSYTSQDYWYDFIFQRWTGPHSFDYHCAVGVSNTFYVASNAVNGTLLNSAITASAATTYKDNGSDITCELVTGTIEGTPMTMSAVAESTIELGGAGVGVVYYISMYDDQNNNLSPATIKLNEVSPLWGTVKWGQFVWRSTISNSQVFTIPWVNPVVFKKMVLSIRVMAAQNVSIKSAYFRIQMLGYTNAT